jgi:predicted RNA-binding protein with PUA-like domain
MANEQRFWLLKSEPSAYSIDDFKRDKKTIWEGVRNYQARNLMRDQMAVGDLFLFYHSNCEETGVVGVGTIAKTKVPDPSALDSSGEYFDPKATKEKNPWVTVEVAFKRRLPKILLLSEIKNDPVLKKMMVAQKGSRLSVQPVTKEAFESSRSAE